MKILVFGASGSGTTTLGMEVAKRIGFTHLDVDDFYWAPTEPPFQKKVPLAKRNSALRKACKRHEHVVVSGSLVSWGTEWESTFDLAIFMTLEKKVRMERLVKREKARFGADLRKNSTIRQTSEAFLEWAAQYDDPEFTGRSLKLHEDWIKKLSCEVLRLAGVFELDLATKLVVSEVVRYSKSTSPAIRFPFAIGRELIEVKCPKCSKKASYYASQAGSYAFKVASEGKVFCTNCGLNKNHTFSSMDYYYAIPIKGRYLYARTLENLKFLRQYFAENRRTQGDPELDFPKVFYENRQELVRLIDKRLAEGTT